MSTRSPRPRPPAPPERRPADAAPPVALVTGAGVRVGRSIALELARAGYAVAVHHHRSATAAASVVADVQRAGGRARTFAADLGRPAAAARLVAQTVRWGGRLDVVVASAAMFDRRPFETIDDVLWSRLLDLNLGAPFRLARAAAAELRRHRGVIVNVLDVAAVHAWRGYAHYCTSKAGLLMLTRVLALELAPQARVCAVAPGTVAFPTHYDARAKKRVLDRIPLGRAGTPDDVARAVRFLVESPYLTGAVIPVDGGRSAGMPADTL